jgi:hypothetical protein
MHDHHQYPQPTYPMIWITANECIKYLERTIPEFGRHFDNDETREHLAEIIGRYMQVDPSVWTISREARERKERMENEVAHDPGLTP